MKYLLDTCVISELVNKTPNARVVEWLKQQDSDSLYLSSVTVGEIKKGIAKRGDDDRAHGWNGRFDFQSFCRVIGL